MITVKPKDVNRSRRAFSREVNKLKRQEIKIAKNANRNVARKSLTKMVRQTAKSLGVKQKVVRGEKITGRSNQWKRVKLWTPSRAGDGTVSKITFNVTDIPFRHLGKPRQLKRGGVRAGKHLGPNSFLGTVKGQKTDGPFVFHRKTSSRYPIDQTVVRIEKKVQQIGNNVSKKSKRPLIVEYEKQRRKILKR